MSEKTAQITELASKPAGEDQIARAQELCGDSNVLKAQLEIFLKASPSRGQMVQYMERLKTGGRAKELDSVVLSICQGLGISEPTNTERLLALQVGLLQEQSRAMQEVLTKLSNQGGQPANSGGSISGLLAGLVIGGILAK